MPADGPQSEEVFWGFSGIPEKAARISPQLPGLALELPPCGA